MFAQDPNPHFTVHEGSNFIIVPWTVFGGECLTVTWTEVDTLHISVPVGVDALVETLWRVVVGVRITIGSTRSTLPHKSVPS